MKLFISKQKGLYYWGIGWYQGEPPIVFDIALGSIIDGISIVFFRLQIWKFCIEIGKDYD